MIRRAASGSAPPQPLRAEIWEIDLNPRRGREQKDVRPCLVVSTNAMNRSRFGTIIVCPITTTQRKTFSWRVGVMPRDLRVADASWRPLPHWVATDQIVTIDTAGRAIRHLATLVAEKKLDAVDDALRLMLNL